MSDKKAFGVRRASLIRTAGATLTVALLLGAPVPAVCAGSRAAGEARQSAESSEVTALLLEVAGNERAMLARRLEYTWTAKVTDHELNKRGEVSKQSVSVYEVYPVRGEFARKLVSQDGVPVSGEKAEKELRRAAKRLEQAAR